LPICAENAVKPQSINQLLGFQNEYYNKVTVYCYCGCRGWWTEWLLLRARPPMHWWCGGCQHDCRHPFAVEIRSLSTLPVWFSPSTASPRHLQSNVACTQKQLQVSMQNTGTFNSECSVRCFVGKKSV